MALKIGAPDNRCCAHHIAISLVYLCVSYSPKPNCSEIENMSLWGKYCKSNTLCEHSKEFSKNVVCEFSSEKYAPALHPGDNDLYGAGQHNCVAELFVVGAHPNGANNYNR